MGGKKDPIWRVVVADQRSPRDGRVIETIGHYNAQTNPSTIAIDEERARSWLARGAQPSDTVRKLLRIQGITPERLTAGSPAPTVATHEDNSGETPRQLLEYLAEGLVDEPEEVSVERFEEDDGTIVLELCVGRRRLRQGDRPRRAHRPGAAHGRESRGDRRGHAACSSTSSIEASERAARGRRTAVDHSSALRGLPARGQGRPRARARRQLLRDAAPVRAARARRGA